MEIGTDWDIEVILQIRGIEGCNSHATAGSITFE